MHSNNMNYHQGLSQSNYNELNFLNSRSSSRGPSHLGSVSSSSFGNHLSSNLDAIPSVLARKENETERYKTRAALLDQGRFNTAPDMKRESEDAKREDFTERLKQMDVERLMLFREHEMLRTREKEVSTLEQLLNKREYEIEELKIQLKDECAKRSSDTQRYSTKMAQKDEELATAKAGWAAVQRELDKSQSKLKSYADYIGGLPTPEDVKKSEQLINDLNSKIAALSDQVADSERKLVRAKQLVKEKMNEIKSKDDEIEGLKASREKLETEYQEYRDASQSVGELIKRCQENDGLAAELECARKVIKSLEEKMRRINTKNEESLAELSQMHGEQVEMTENLKMDLNAKEKQITDIHVQIKKLSDEKQELLDSSTAMSEKLKSYESIMNSELERLLQNMFKELNICTTDLNDVVQNCLDLNNGRPVDINSLLGLKLKLSDIDSANAMGIINAEFLTKKLNEIKQMRVKLKELRTKITDKYAESLGENMSCIQQ